MNFDTEGRDAAALAIRKMYQTQQPQDWRRSTMLDSSNLNAVQKREQHAAMAHAEGLLRATPDNFCGDLRKADAPTCTEVIRKIHAGGRGDAESRGQLGHLAKLLVARGPQPDASLDAIKKAHRGGRALSAAGMHALMNPQADVPRPVAKGGMRTEAVTIGGREVFKLEVPETQQPAVLDLADTGGTTGVDRQAVPSQRVSVWGRVMPEQVGNGRSTLPVESAASATSSGSQDNTIQAIKQAWASPMPFLR